MDPGVNGLPGLAQTLIVAHHLPQSGLEPAPTLILLMEDQTALGLTLRKNKRLALQLWNAWNVLICRQILIAIIGRVWDIVKKANNIIIF